LQDYPLPQQKQPSSELLSHLSQVLAPVLRLAGEKILLIYQKPEHSVQTKRDLSPVTEADVASHDLIIAHLAAITPDWPVVSEEDSEHHTASGRVIQEPIYWLLDPLDGTKEFIARTGEFSINLGLVVNQRAFFGLLYNPVEDLLYQGGIRIAAQKTCFSAQEPPRWQPISARPRPPDGGILISSRRSSATPANETFAGRQHLGSALKFGRLAEGKADFYLRTGNTMEWDTCAGQALLEAAGGSVCDLHGKPLTYGKPGYLNPGFIARGL
jgi:3'(2'), 5'-bisphosphate nucleotidase